MAQSRFAVLAGAGILLWQTSGIIYVSMVLHKIWRAGHTINPNMSAVSGRQNPGQRSAQEPNPNHFRSAPTPLLHIDAAIHY